MSDIVVLDESTPLTDVERMKLEEHERVMQEAAFNVCEAAKVVEENMEKFDSLRVFRDAMIEVFRSNLHRMYGSPVQYMKKRWPVQAQFFSRARLYQFEQFAGVLENLNTPKVIEGAVAPIDVQEAAEPHIAEEDGLPKPTIAQGLALAKAPADERTDVWEIANKEHEKPTAKQIAGIIERMHPAEEIEAIAVEPPPVNIRYDASNKKLVIVSKRAGRVEMTFDEFLTGVGLQTELLQLLNNCRKFASQGLRKKKGCTTIDACRVIKQEIDDMIGAEVVTDTDQEPAEEPVTENPFETTEPGAE